MCELCVVSNDSHPDAYFDKTQRRCKECPDNPFSRAGAVVGGTVGVIALMYGLWYIWRHPLKCSSCSSRFNARWAVLKRFFLFVSIFIRVGQRAAQPVRAW
jgi:hypothetical protein